MTTKYKYLTWDSLDEIIFSKKYTREFSHTSKSSNITKKYKFPKNVFMIFSLDQYSNRQRVYNVYYSKKEPFYGGYAAVAFYKLDILGSAEPSTLKKGYRRTSTLAAKCITKSGFISKAFL